jgi:hypothetical protein
MKLFKAISAVLLTAILLAGCSQMFDIPQTDTGSKTSEGKGAVQINIAGANARTAFPDMGQLEFTATFTNDDPEITADPETFESGDEIELLPGNWTINIEARSDSGITVGTAVIEDVLIVENDTVKIENVLIRPVKIGEDPEIIYGTVELKIKYVGDFDIINDAKVFFDNETYDIKDLDKDGDYFVFERDDVPPGSYLIRVVLNHDGRSAGDVYVVHIYSDMLTTHTFTFYETSLVPTKELTVNVPITFSGNIDTLTLKLDRLSPVTEFTVDNDTYTFSLPVPEDADDFEGTLTIETENGSELEVLVQAFSYGTGTHTLDEIKIFTLTATVGANGRLDVYLDSVLLTGIHPGGTHKEDFINGSDIKLVPVPDTGYELDEFKVNDVDITVPEHEFDIDADTTVLVTVKDDVDPNLIFEWKAGATSISQTGTWATSNEGITLSGVGINDTVKARVVGGTVSANENGITINATAATGRLMIGSNNNTATTHLATDTGADFDFLSDGRNIKVTVGFDVVTQAAAAGRAIWLLVNNNQSAMLDTSPLYSGIAGVANNSTASRIHASNTLFPVAPSQEVTGTLNVSNIIYGRHTLDNAFISICALGGAGGQAGYNITIKSIRIEYDGAPPAPPTSIEVLRGTTVVTALEAEPTDDPIHLGARMLPAASGTLTWTSSNTGVATVNSRSGMVTIVGQGNTDITVKHDQSATETTVTLSVSAPPETTSITISGTNVQPGTPKTLAMNVSQSPVTLTVERNPSGSVGGTITWSSDNTAAVTVNSESGQLTAVAAGVATITATLTGVTGGPFADTVLVTVTDGGGGTPPPPNWSWSFNRATWTNQTGASTNFELNDKNVRLWNSTGAAHADKDGFIFDGMSVNVKRFMIGSHLATNTTSSGGDPAGQFDFSTNHGKRVQIAVEFEVLEKGTTPGMLRLAINNSHGTGAANSLQLSPTAAWLQQIDLVPLDVGHSGTIGGIFDPATAALNTSSTLTVEELRTEHLANSFISLSLPADSSRILIKSVSVTYID